MFNPIRYVIIVLILAVWSLVACSASETPNANPSVVAEVKAAAATTDTPAPTVSVPTRTPTLVVSSTPTPTVIIQPSATPQTHVVEPGETLFSIALDYDISIEMIAEMNNIDPENDFLQISQTLIIPAPTVDATSFNQFESDITPIGALRAISSTEQITTTGLSSPNTTEVDIVTTTNITSSLQSLPAASVYTGPALPEITHAPNINPLTGLPVADVSAIQRRPILVRIGNDVGARQSQVGLNQADVVYEEIAEWWLTRFTAIYLSNAPAVVAPIRSARLINVLLAPQYQGALAHSGGSDPVRWEISQAPFVNLDEFYNPAPYFYRPNEGWQTRLAVNVVSARDYMQTKGNESPVPLMGFNFNDTLVSGEIATTISIPYPRSTSATEWRYDAARGKYLRWIIGTPLIDAHDGTQIAADNVIVYFAEHQKTDIVEDSNGATAIRMLINGQGPAIFFRDGKINKGFWQTDGTRPPYFTLVDGSPYHLKPGNSWVEVVPTYFEITADGVVIE